VLKKVLTCDIKLTRVNIAKQIIKQEVSGREKKRKSTMGNNMKKKDIKESKGPTSNVLLRFNEVAVTSFFSLSISLSLLLSLFFLLRIFQSINFY